MKILEIDNLVRNYKIAKMENEHISKLYTTNLNEIIEVHCH